MLRIRINGCSAVVCTDLTGKELHGQVGVVTSGSLYGVMVSTLAWNARDVGSISCSSQNISHFHLTHNTGFHDQCPAQAVHCMVLEAATQCICM